jgi:hypothetical protein
MVIVLFTLVPASIGIVRTIKVSYLSTHISNPYPHSSLFILDVYQAANATGVVVVGGSCPSVGAAGGWVLGGGHSSLSPQYGLGVDSKHIPNFTISSWSHMVSDVLEFEIVTPDGNVRTANKYQEEDLFWALRGGGPGFGVCNSMLSTEFSSDTQPFFHFL